jgi:Spy/CpxP family protein refolding chaperone
MKTLRPIALTLALAAIAAGPALAQRGQGGFGRGEAWGFRGAGLGNWALHEGGIDSIAARFQLTDEQRGELEQLAAAFREENAEVLSRWEQMRDEIQALYTEDQMPTRAAIQRIGEKHNHPGQEMSLALDQLFVESAAILTPQQRQSFRGQAYGRMGAWGGRMMTGRSARQSYGGHRGMRGHQRSFHRGRPGWQPPDSQ